jgi:eukaryotic-like serine/threonine-protein kinase
MLSEEMRPYRKRMIDAGLRESLAMVRELDGDPRAEVEVIRGYSGLAQVQYEAGEPAAGLLSQRKAIDLAERLAARDKGSVRSRDVLAHVLHRASTLLPDPEERRSLGRRSTEILQGLVAESTGSDRRARLLILAMNHYNDGHFLYGLGRSAEAITAFLAARESYDRVLADGTPQPHELCLAGKNLLYVCRAYGERFEFSLEAGQQALKIFRKLAADHPDIFDYTYHLCITLDELGSKGIAAANWDLAIANLESARSTLKTQAQRWGRVVSRMAMIQESLARADYNLRIAYGSDPVRFAGPVRELSHELFEICEKLSLVQTLSWNLRIALAESCLSQAGYRQDDGLALDLDLLQKAEGLWEGIHRVSQGDVETRSAQVTVRRKIAEAHEAGGRNGEAARWRRRSIETAGGDPDLIYELAVGYARGAGLVGRVPTKLDARQLELRRARLTAEALAMLAESAAAGFHDPRRLRNEPAFETLRSLPEFRVILLDLEFPADPFAAPCSGR